MFYISLYYIILFFILYYNVTMGEVMGGVRERPVPSTLEMASGSASGGGRE